jgi:hypothetical protein
MKMSSTGISNAQIDPFASLPEGVTGDVARSAIADLVKGDGVSLTDANIALQARGLAPLAANSKDYALVQFDKLTNDSAFQKRALDGDPEALAQMFTATLRLQQAKGALADRPMTANEYDLRVAQYLPPETAPDKVQAYSDGLADFVSLIGLPAENAKALVADHFAALNATAGMDPEQLNAYGDEQMGALRSALGDDVETLLRDASKVLSTKAGRELNLLAIARSNGARAALGMYFQAQVLAARK